MAGPAFSSFTIPGSVAARALADITFDLSGGAAPYASVFDPAVVQVDATVTSPTGSITTQPCFWMRAMTAGTPTAGHGETYTAGASHWHLRYKFPIAGVWTFRVTALDAGGSTVSAVQSITVTAPTISLSPWRLANKWYFTFDDGTWIPMIGQNDAQEDRDYTLDGTVGFAKYLGYIGSNGGKVSRFVLSTFYRNGPAYMSSAAMYGGFDNFGLGLGQYSQQNCFRIDEYLRIAGVNGLTVLFAYNTSTEWSAAAGAHWADSPYNTANGGMIAPADPAFFLTSAGALKYQKMKARYMIARWAPYPAFGAIEHMDEGAAVGTGFFAGQNTIANASAWVGTMGTYIRSIDPWAHLLTWSDEWEPTTFPGAAGQHTDPIFAQSTVDFGTLHAYQTSPWVINDRKGTTSQIIRDFQLRLGKPLLHTAAGLYRTPAPPEPNFDPTTSVLTQVQKDHILAGTHPRSNVLAALADGFTGGWHFYHGSYLAEDAARHRVSGTLPIVGGGGGTTPANLQTAINNTPSGGTLVIAGGSYNGPIAISRPITLILNGTVIHSPNGLQSCVTLSGPGITIDGSGWIVDGTGNSQTFGYGIAPYAADGFVIRNGSVTNFVYAGIGILNSHGVLVEKMYIGQIGVGQANDTNAYGIFFSSDGSGLYSSGTAQDILIEDVPTWQGMNAHETQNGLTWRRITVRRTRRAFWAYPPYQRNNGLLVDACRAESPLPVTYNTDGFVLGLTDGATFTNNFISNDYGHTGSEYHSGIRDIGNASTNLVVSGTTYG